MWMEAIQANEWHVPRSSFAAIEKIVHIVQRGTVTAMEKQKVIALHLTLGIWHFIGKMNIQQVKGDWSARDSCAKKKRNACFFLFYPLIRMNSIQCNRRIIGIWTINWFLIFYGCVNLFYVTFM